MTTLRAICGALAFATTLHASEDWLDRAERALSFSLPFAAARVQVGGSLDLEGYHGDQGTTGFVFSERNTSFTPRLSLFADVQRGRDVYAFLQARVDRGFDPADAPLRGRIDEYALRWMLAQNGRLNLQVGQFATVMGGWVGRHRSWDNPFVGAPLPYAHMTGMYDAQAPRTRVNLIPGHGEDEYDHNPLIWGPSYTSGAELFGRANEFDYALEVKNTGPASRPEAWSVGSVGFQAPAYNARIGWRPDARWKIGISFSDSSYVLPSAALLAGTSRRDYRETLWVQDVSFAWAHWQIWTELFAARLTVPRDGDAQAYAGYVETRYKFTPQLSGALRWGRETFSAVPDDAGRPAAWGEDVWRLEAAAVYRLTPHMQIKAQVSEHRTVGDRATTTYAAQFTTRF